MSSQSLDLFLRACEVPATPTLLIGARGEVGLPVSMTHTFAVVGSDPRCDVVIDDPAVSPRHCYLQAIGPKVLCVGLGGAGLGLAPASWIDERQAVEVGGRLVRLDGAPRVEREDVEVRLLADPVPRISLEFQTDTIKTRWRMRRAVALVGSARECTVRLNGASVSPFHCALVHTGHGLWVVDLLGRIESPETGGLRINRDRVRFGRIDPGDVLQVGQFAVSVLTLPPSSRRSRVSTSVPTTAVAEIEGSGEIEVIGDGKKKEESQPAVPEVEAIRREYERRLDEQSEAHAAEVEGLRLEIEDLRDLIEELRTPPASLPRRRRRDISVRVVGTSPRRADAGRDAHSGVALTRPDLGSGHGGDLWPSLGGLIASAQGVPDGT